MKPLRRQETFRAVGAAEPGSELLDTSASRGLGAEATDSPASTDALRGTPGGRPGAASTDREQTNQLEMVSMG